MENIRQNVRRWNMLAALFHVAPAFTNIIYWEFYKVLNIETIRTNATIGRFVSSRWIHLPHSKIISVWTETQDRNTAGNIGLAKMAADK
ncbi:MAG: hypothetical protein FJ218_05530 [Ignavibacteria bacterium]|nr:hypothetical protein [Ignavibacteria bacterium]